MWSLQTCQPSSTPSLSSTNLTYEPSQYPTAFHNRTPQISITSEFINVNSFEQIMTQLQLNSTILTLIRFIISHKLGHWFYDNSTWMRKTKSILEKKKINWKIWISDIPSFANITFTKRFWYLPILNQYYIWTEKQCLHFLSASSLLSAHINIFPG